MLSNINEEVLYNDSEVDRTWGYIRSILRFFLRSSSIYFRMAAYGKPGIHTGQLNIDTSTALDDDKSVDSRWQGSSTVLPTHVEQTF